MFKTRNSFFETNSSSTHAISLSKGDYSPEEINARYSIEIDSGDFGWEVEEYGDFYNKCSYLITAFQCSPTIKDRIKNIIKEVTNLPVVFNFTDKDYINIDHQGLERGTHWGVVENDDILKRYLFDTNTILYTGNDNISNANVFYKGIEFIPGINCFPISIEFISGELYAPFKEKEFAIREIVASYRNNRYTVKEISFKKGHVTVSREGKAGDIQLNLWPDPKKTKEWRPNEILED